MKTLIKGEEIFLQIALLVMSVLAFAQVITRYVFAIPTVWIEETTRYFMVWLIFISMATAAASKAHLGVDIMGLIAPPKVQKWIAICMQAIQVLFGLVFIGLTWQVVAFQFELGQKSPALQIPMGVVFCGVLLGAILYTIHQAGVMRDTFKINSDDFGKDAGEEGQF